MSQERDHIALVTFASKKGKMKVFTITIQTEQPNHVTVDFVEEFFKKLMGEKIHNPVTIRVDEELIEEPKL